MTVCIMYSICIFMYLEEGYIGSLLQRYLRWHKLDVSEEKHKTELLKNKVVCSVVVLNVM